MPTHIPIYDPGQAISGTATGAAVTGGRLLRVAAGKPDGGAIPVAHCGAADAPIGASQADAAQDVPGGVTVYPGQVLPLESAAAITAGVAVEVAADGRVQPLGTGRRVGVAFQAATAAGEFPLIQLQL